MEGITDPIYRETLMAIYPEWKYFSTDFLRLPTVGELKEKHIIKHFGENIYNTQEYFSKTYFQILTTLRVNNPAMIKLISNMGIKLLDLNLGCPSKKVNAHGGGSYLLQDLEALKIILEQIRENFSHSFSVKIRLGYKNTDNFLKLLEIFEYYKIDHITIHARTKQELYKGHSDWNYFKIASENCSIPLILNGDINTLEDINNVTSTYKNNGLMIARGALRSPWLAKEYYSKENIKLNYHHEIINYYNCLLQNYTKYLCEPEYILKRFKSFSVYIIRDLTLRKLLLRSQSLDNFINILGNAPLEQKASVPFDSFMA